ncbi:hypothetical protein [Rugosimonospora africana]|uniref:Uncharacterized protein n=1 Tax=Rugosimonospora africana TaxID=556532 RepID=A0A8J3QTJ1_9ACTN|nr:hypothetical protein [Rugosimonospora africana]GIH17205.1 hypothetical protein Raf01_53770 [Rugosimonospora africana]
MAKTRTPGTTGTSGAIPAFERVSPDVDLYALNTRDESGVAGYWAGYRPTPGTDAGPTISLLDAWLDNGGVYLFCARTFTDAPAFVAAVDAWRVAHPPDFVRFMWVGDPDHVDESLVLHLWAQPRGEGLWRWWHVERDAVFVLGEYDLVVPEGAGLHLADPTLTRFALRDRSLLLRTPGGAQFASRPDTAAISLAGSGLGTWAATMALGGDGNPAVAALVPQLRYCTPTSRPVPMPLLRPGGAALLGDLRLDPLYPTLPQRTAIDLRGVSGNPPPLTSNLRTRLGHAVTLTPTGQGSRWPARLVFNVSPGLDGTDHYLTADGAFLLTAPSADPRLALGLSGSEYVALPASTATCRFIAGQPAFADDTGVLTPAATTAHLELLPVAPGGAGLVYYAQPELAPWFATNAVDRDGFLQSLLLPAATLPGWPAAPAPAPDAGSGLPVGCYLGVSPADCSDAAWLEQTVLAPTRRARIGGTAPDGSEVRCVTPQGISASAAIGQAGWGTLAVASFPGEAIRSLTFTDVSSTMRGRLQASELFAVIADPRVLLDNASADSFTVTMDGWTFDLAPDSWRTGEDSPTMLLFKLSGRSLRDLTSRPAAWSWPEAAGDDIARTSARLTAMFDAAAAAPAQSPLGRFFREVVTDPRWSGVLFLNAPISAGQLPDEMRFVTAGIDPDRLFAHHVGFSHTPFVVTPAGVLSSGRTATFALIEYDDDTELAPTTTVPFAFVTQRLEVRFAGGAVADMSARVQLIVNELFGSRLTRLDPVGGNSLTITGSYQRQDGVPGYQFGLERPAVYATEAAALDSIEVLGVAVRALRASGSEPTVAVEFGLDGNLRFAQLGGFDLFSYGPQQAVPEGVTPEDGFVRFADLTVTMSFPVADPSDQTFASDEGRLRVDLANSRARRGSLATGFPVTVTGVLAVAAGSQRPTDLGFAPVLAPLDQVPLTPPWYGLTMRVDLGTLGSLADAAGLSATVLAAWMPGKPNESVPVYCGFKVAGLDDRQWPVQGVLRVGFRGYEFIVDSSGPSPAYLLRLRRLALYVLGWGFPPGQTDVLVFGDSAATQTRSVGWYGAHTSGRQP